MLSLKFIELTLANFQEFCPASVEGEVATIWGFTWSIHQSFVRAKSFEYIWEINTRLTRIQRPGEIKQRMKQSIKLKA